MFSAINNEDHDIPSVVDRQ